MTGHQLSRESKKRKGRGRCSRRKFVNSWGGGWFSEHWLAKGQHYFKIKFTLIWTNVCWRWRRHDRMPTCYSSAKSLQYRLNSSPGRPGTHSFIWVIPRGWEKSSYDCITMKFVVFFFFSRTNLVNKILAI